MVAKLILDYYASVYIRQFFAKYYFLKIFYIKLLILLHHFTNFVTKVTIWNLGISHQPGRITESDICFCP